VLRILPKAFLKRLDSKGGKAVQDIEFHAMEGLRNYAWPGNIRELENVMERAYVSGTAHLLTKDHFPMEIKEASK